MSESDLYPIPAEPTVVKITPEQAADWLDNRNVGNRTLNVRIATRYASAMTEGRWMVTPQGVAFDEEGFLLDGQHRLRAIVIAGIPVEMFVAPGFKRESFSVLDTGHKRRASQVMKVKHSAAVAAAARIVGVIDGSLTVGVIGGIYATYADNDQVIAVVDSWPELIDLAPAASLCYQSCHIPLPMHLAVLAQASRTKYANRMDEWISGLSDGVGLNRTDSRLLLRNRCIKEASRFSGQQSRLLAYRLIVRAWNAYAAGLEMGILRVRDDEATPEVIR